MLALAAAAYVAVRETSAFAIDTIDVRGASPELAARVKTTLAPLLGTSLVALDGAALERRLEALPAVVDARYDRSFPHTLRVTVVPERPVAVVRSGTGAFLVSARARVLARISRGDEPALPRMWLPAATALPAGSFLAPAGGGATARALAAALTTAFPPRIGTASLGRTGLVFRLRSGLELRLGDPTDIRLKLAVARRALAVLPPGTTYLDVGLPLRPVAGADIAAVTNPQVSSGG